MDADGDTLGLGDGLTDADGDTEGLTDGDGDDPATLSAKTDITQSLPSLDSVQSIVLAPAAPALL